MNETRICKNGHEYEFRKQCLVCKRAYAAAKREERKAKRRPRQLVQAASLSREELERERAASLERMRQRSQEEIMRLKRLRVREAGPIPIWKARPRIIRPEAP